MNPGRGPKPWALAEITWLFLSAGIVPGVAGQAMPGATASAPRLAALPASGYPATRRGDLVETLHGTRVADPYRWLEDDNADDTRAWAKAQNELARSVLDALPERAAFARRIGEIFNSERYGVPKRTAGWYYYSRNDGLQAQNVIYRTRTLEGRPEVLFDPNQWSADGTVALASYQPSDDGRHVAYAVATGGSDWREIRVRSLVTGRDLPDRVRWTKFQVPVWTRDGRGFFYARYDAPRPGEELKSENTFQRVYYHRLGEDQERDTLVHDRPDDPGLAFGVQVSDDGHHLVLSEGSTRSRAENVHWRALGPAGQYVPGKFRPLLTGFSGLHTFIGNDGSRLYFQTDEGAPRGKVMTIDVARAQAPIRRDVIAEGPEALFGVSMVGGRLMVSVMKDARSEVRVHRLDGTFERALPLPGLGTVSGLDGKLREQETFFSYQDFVRPPTIYRYDFAAARRAATAPPPAGAAGAISEWRRPRVDFDPDAFETRQVFYRSRDGTSVPMFVVHRRGVVADGTNPTLLYGYGGFNVPQKPWYSVSRIAWLERGGVFALANIRGGGEYGTASWYESATKTRKQTTNDDFIAAAEWLIANRWTRPDRLAINGGSQGGMLVGAVLNQRPELFGAAVPEVGVMDMLRFHRFTIGRFWIADYGSPDDPAEFAAIKAYSPLHNVRADVRYPPVLVLTADHDDRVVPGHSFKYVATLQANATGGPFLLRVETSAGHGAGTSTQKAIDARADVYAFLAAALGLDPAVRSPQPVTRP